MSGRVSDIAVYEPNTAIFYVGTAHGGVWKTTNNGVDLRGPVPGRRADVDRRRRRLAEQPGSGVGRHRRIEQPPEHVVGRRRLQVDRRRQDLRRTWASAPPATSTASSSTRATTTSSSSRRPGSLWGPGGERGVYKTTDGGRTWKQTLKVDDDTGANDLVMDPTNHQILYATTYQRRRTACCMNGGGPGSGIWKSTDAGETWTRLEERSARGAARPHRHRRLPPASEHPVRRHRRAGGSERRGAAAGARQQPRARQRTRRRRGSTDPTTRARRGGR